MKTTKNLESGSTQEVCCNERRVDITLADLPLSCPPRNLPVWNGHPRVYLPLEEPGEMICPYCSTRYVLKEFKA